MGDNQNDRNYSQQQFYQGSNNSSQYGYQTNQTYSVNMGYSQPNYYPQQQQMYQQNYSEQELYEEDDYDNLDEIEKEMSKVAMSYNQANYEREMLESVAELNHARPNNGSKPTGAYVPQDAIPQQNGKLTQHAGEFWFPESRNCSCCKGFKHGCGCCKTSGVDTCQDANCIDDAFKSQVSAELATRSTAADQHASSSSSSSRPPFVSANSSAANSASAAPATSYCKFEMSPAGCRFGSTCRFKHANPSSSNSNDGSINQPQQSQNFAPYRASGSSASSATACSYFARANANQMSYDLTEETLEEGRIALYQLEKQLKVRGNLITNDASVASSKAQNSQSERKMLDQTPREARLNTRLESLGLTVEELDDRGLLNGGGSVPSYYTSMKNKNRRTLELQPRSHRLQVRGKETFSKLLSGLFHMLQILCRRGLNIEDYCRHRDPGRRGLMPKKQFYSMLRSIGLPFSSRELSDVVQHYVVPTSDQIDYMSFLKDSQIIKSNNSDHLLEEDGMANIGSNNTDNDKRSGNSSPLEMGLYTSVLSDIKRMIIECIHKYKKYTQDDVYRMFAKWDAEGTSTITSAQFLRVLARLHVDLCYEDQDFLVELLDTHGMGRIEFEGLLSYCFSGTTIDGSADNNNGGNYGSSNNNVQSPGGMLSGGSLSIDDNAGETLSAVSTDGNNSIEQKSLNSNTNNNSNNMYNINISGTAASGRRPHTATSSRPYNDNSNNNYTNNNNLMLSSQPTSSPIVYRNSSSGGGDGNNNYNNNNSSALASPRLSSGSNNGVMYGNNNGVVVGNVSNRSMQRPLTASARVSTQQQQSTHNNSRYMVTPDTIASSKMNNNHHGKNTQNYMNDFNHSGYNTAATGGQPRFLLAAAAVDVEDSQFVVELPDDVLHGEEDYLGADNRRYDSGGRNVISNNNIKGKMNLSVITQPKASSYTRSYDTVEEEMDENNSQRNNYKNSGSSSYNKPAAVIITKEETEVEQSGYNDITTTQDKRSFGSLSHEDIPAVQQQQHNHNVTTLPDYNNYNKSITGQPSFGNNNNNRGSGAIATNTSNGNNWVAAGSNRAITTQPQYNPLQLQQPPQYTSYQMNINNNNNERDDDNGYNNNYYINNNNNNASHQLNNSNSNNNNYTTAVNSGAWKEAKDRSNNFYDSSNSNYNYNSNHNNNDNNIYNNYNSGNSGGNAAFIAATSAAAAGPMTNKNNNRDNNDYLSPRSSSSNNNNNSTATPTTEPVDHLILLANQILTTLREIIMTRYRRGNSLQDIFQHFDRDDKHYFDAKDFVVATSDLRIETSSKVASIAVNIMAMDAEEDGVGGKLDRVSFGEFKVFVLDADHSILAMNVQEQLAQLLEQRGREYLPFMINMFWTEEDSVGLGSSSGSEGGSTSRSAANSYALARQNGFVSKIAFVSALPRIGLTLTSSEVARITDRFDVDGNDHYCSVQRFINMIQGSAAWRHSEQVLICQDEAIEEADFLRQQLAASRTSGDAASSMLPELPEELISMCEYLGIKVLSEQRMLWIAADALKAPLPVPWTAQKDNTGRTYFYNHLSGQTKLEHPLDPHFRKLRDKYRTPMSPVSNSRGISLAGCNNISGGVSSIAPSPNSHISFGGIGAGLNPAPLNQSMAAVGQPRPQVQHYSAGLMAIAAASTGAANLSSKSNNYSATGYTNSNSYCNKTSPTAATSSRRPQSALATTSATTGETAANATNGMSRHNNNNNNPLRSHSISAMVISDSSRVNNNNNNNINNDYNKGINDSYGVPANINNSSNSNNNHKSTYDNPQKDSVNVLNNTNNTINSKQPRDQLQSLLGSAAYNRPLSAPQHIQANNTVNNISAYIDATQKLLKQTNEKPVVNNLESVEAIYRGTYNNKHSEGKNGNTRPVSAKRGAVMSSSINSNGASAVDRALGLNNSNNYYYNSNRNSGNKSRNAALGISESAGNAAASISTNGGKHMKQLSEMYDDNILDKLDNVIGVRR